jgi:DNA-binding IclR family transcriptional regulator
MVLGILVMGPSATFDSEWNGRIAQPLRQCAQEITRRLGRDGATLAT